MPEKALCFIVGVIVGAAIGATCVMFVFNMSYISVYKDAVCNNAGYLEAAKVGGINGKWYCVIPILDIPGLQNN